VVLVNKSNVAAVVGQHVAWRSGTSGGRRPRRRSPAVSNGCGTSRGRSKRSGVRPSAGTGAVSALPLTSGGTRPWRDWTGPHE